MVHEKRVRGNRMKAVRIHEQGPPEVLKYEEVPDPELRDDEALVQLKAVGVNFTDVYTRSGMYPAKLPLIIGMEGAGVVSAIGSHVTGSLRIGDRVAYSNAVGAYAEYAAVQASRLVKLPEGLDEKLAAAGMLQGMTADYLVNDTFRLKEGHRVLIHAGAGGVGLLLIQMARDKGAQVMVTVSTEEKARIAKDMGADEAIVYTTRDFEEDVKALTGGRGVDVVYDSVGKTTFEKSLKCLSSRGCLVLFGQSSGMVPPIAPSVLAKGSLFLTRPMLGDYIATRDELEQRAGRVFGELRSGKLKVKIPKTLPLSQAVDAHRLLESRETIGKLLLIP
jgi:NADPH:quinone reductase